MTNREHCLISLIISTYFFPFIPVLMFSYQYLCFECCLQMAQVCLLLLYSVCVSSFCTHYCPVPWDICVLVHLHLDSLAINRKALIYFILYPSRIILNILLKYNVHIHIENVSVQLTGFSQVQHIHSTSTQLKKQIITSAPETSLMLVPHHHCLYQR